MNRSELWVPMSFTQGELVQNGSWNFNIVGRLKADVTATQARQDMDRVAQEVMRAFPPGMGTLKIHAQVESLGETTVSARGR